MPLFDKIALFDKDGLAKTREVTTGAAFVASKTSANGRFIGSGVIESECKTVIGQRFKQSGMIWSLKGAKYCSRCALLTLHKSLVAPDLPIF